MASVVNIDNNNLGNKIPPKMFLLYISFGSMFMFFSSLCSAIIVKKGDFKHWQDVVIPDSFFISTIIIVISSITIQLAKNNIEQKAKFKMFSILTVILSLLFVYFQLNGWKELTANGVLFRGNPSGSFIYVVSLFHGIHYLGGIIFLLLLVYRYRKVVVNETNVLNFKILTQYWHYIGLVWVLLFIFFKLLIYK